MASLGFQLKVPAMEGGSGGDGRVPAVGRGVAGAPPRSWVAGGRQAGLATGAKVWERRTVLGLGLGGGVRERPGRPGTGSVLSGAIFKESSYQLKLSTM